MALIHALFAKLPEAALFLALALGYLAGKISFGRFQLGGVAGTLLVAVGLSQFGVSVSDTVKSIMFALFIYAVGFISGPQFFGSLNRAALKEIWMALFVAVSALATVLILAKWFHFDAGTAAGIAAGGLTQSAIIGTAGDAIARLNLPAAETARQTSNVAVGYAVTYIFGSLGPIIMVSLLPRLMKVDLKDEARKIEATLGQPSGDLAPDEFPLFYAYIARTFRLDPVLAGRTVGDIEHALLADQAAIERVLRADQAMLATPDLVLAAGDVIAVAGRRAGLIEGAKHLGEELAESPSALKVIGQVRKIVISHKEADGLTLAQLRERATPDQRHGVLAVGLIRQDRAMPLLPGTVLRRGDILRLYGAREDVARVCKILGYPVIPSDRTDFIVLGAGVFVGLLIGLITVRVAGIPLTLGSGGGALLAGLVFGWLRGRSPALGNLPPAAARILQDFGLAAFVAVVGLNAGATAWTTIRSSGALIFGTGIIVTMLPLLLAYVFGRYVLRYQNAAILAGAMMGARSANPGFGALLDTVESNVVTVPFAITYALANVLLTLLGPLIVGLM